MKVLILAGDLGSILSEETSLVPKPMVEIGSKPILWHVMKMYSHYGFNDFIILTGYKSHVIKEYFINYYNRYSDITVDMANNSVEIHKVRHDPWKVTMLYTGQDTMTGGRIKQAQQYIGNERFMLTYGDGVANIDINDIISKHEKSKKILTMTTVQSSGKFGSVTIQNDNTVESFIEKSQENQNWINGGFFVCENKIFDYIPANNARIIFEREPLENLAKDGQLNAYKHMGFWKCMDTLKDKNDLTDMWVRGEAPWLFWSDEDK
ncbi:MAG: glucose-1-phosphate cytidylyltransferase [Bacteroidales bacterium]|jgi:glucose-1-phosphate cytidylyltransferase|nr:glucose-1-phosphate cytidylyltransferase [Bacteroidales bacterium]